MRKRYGKGAFFAIEVRTKYDIEQYCDNRQIERTKGRPATTHLDSLKDDVGLKVKYLKSAMVERETWRRIVKDASE